MSCEPQLSVFIVLSVLVYPTFVNGGDCSVAVRHNALLRFSLVRQCQRSTLTAMLLENTQTLERCMSLAKKSRGLALNYAPYARRWQEPKFVQQQANDSEVLNYKTTQNRNRQYFWQQPQEFFNCHVLQCPENATFRNMVKDNRFDYFSLFADITEGLNYTCVPEVGLFTLQTDPQTFKDSVITCGNSTTFNGSLAHVVSAKRTNGMAQLLRSYSIPLAYVGLYFDSIQSHHNEFFTADNASLNCYLYRAWAPGYPKISQELQVNRSCVAITSHSAWITVDCERKLPFICEVHTSKPEDHGNDLGTILADECWKHLT